MRLMASAVNKWVKRLAKSDEEGHDELLAAIDAFEVAEDAFCQARDHLLEILVAVGFPARGTKGEGVRENIERLERYMKGRGYIRPQRPRGPRFGMRCPGGPSAMLATAGPETEMTMEFEEGELVANDGDDELLANPPAFVQDEECWERAVSAADHAGADDRYGFANWWYHQYCG